MRVIAFYGKGGIGKSTVVSNLAVLFAQDGRRVLLLGCDPKADSCYTLVPGRVVTVMDEWLARGEADLRREHCVMQGRHGVDCIEVGGPVPGTGCGGRGITKALELVGDPGELRQRYDVILFDVLGDVVCGGFSAPMRERYAEEVYIVTSGEPRSLYAANNITQAVARYGPGGVGMGGFIGNLRGLDDETERIEELADLVSSVVVEVIDRDVTVSRAEAQRLPVVDLDPDCPASRAFRRLFSALLAVDPTRLTSPRPLPRGDFERFFLNREP